MADLKAKSRKRWRDRGYYAQNGETHNAHSHRTDDHLGFADLVCYPRNPVDYPTEVAEAVTYKTALYHGAPTFTIWPAVYVQATSWSNATARRNKILREKTGRGQWAIHMRDLAEIVLHRGDLIVVEGWRLNESHRYEVREIWITQEMIDAAREADESAQVGTG